jgi:hypothetical protein
MEGKQQFRLALAAAAAGFAWGYLRHRRDKKAPLIGLLQALEWFVSYGGALALIERARAAVEGVDVEELEAVERVTHIRQMVDERTGTEG